MIYESATKGGDGARLHIQPAVLGASTKQTLKFRGLERHRVQCLALLFTMTLGYFDVSVARVLFQLECWHF